MTTTLALIAVESATTATGTSDISAAGDTINTEAATDAANTPIAGATVAVTPDLHPKQLRVSPTAKEPQPSQSRYHQQPHPAPISLTFRPGRRRSQYGDRLMTPSRSPQPSILERRQSRRRHAYTLIEIVIGLSLTMVLLVASVAWVSTTRSSSTPIEQQASVRDANFVRLRLSDDLLAARPCDPAAAGWPLISADGSNLEFYADVVDTSGVTGTVESLTLSRDVSSGSLRRGVVAGTGTCTMDASSATMGIVIENVAPDGVADYFTATDVDNTTVNIPNCAALGAECDITSVRINSWPSGPRWIPLQRSST